MESTNSARTPKPTETVVSAKNSMTHTTESDANAVPSLLDSCRAVKACKPRK